MVSGKNPGSGGSWVPSQTVIGFGQKPGHPGLENRKLKTQDRLGAKQSAFVSERDAAAREVVGGDLEGHSVAGEHANSKAAHFARDRRVYFMSVCHEDPEGRIRQHFRYGSFELDCFFLSHRSPISCVLGR